MFSTYFKLRARNGSKKFSTNPKPFVIQVSSIYPKNQNNTVTPSTSLGQYFSHYCKESTIHGLKYVGERGRYLVEKVIWSILILLVCVFCSLLIHKTYYKWKSSPVILSFENGETPIFNIPFPAVTICPEAKFNPDKFDMTEVYRKKQLNISTNERDDFVFDLYTLVCTDVRITDEYEDVKSTKNRYFLEQSDFDDFFKLFPELNLWNDNIFWMGKSVPKSLKKVLTKNGVCYTFNMLSFEEVFSNKTFFKSPENDIKTYNFDISKGYTTETEMKTYPRRTFLAEAEGGLLLDRIVTNVTHLNPFCEMGVSGFKVILHSVFELPNLKKHFRLPLDGAMYVAVKPDLITISSELFNYAPSERNCYFYKERPLWIYNVYTQENCLNECLVNCTLLHCGCIPFYIPRPAGVKICGPDSILCMLKTEVNYLDKHYCAQDCDCLPSCYSLTYKMELSQTDWSWQKAPNVLSRLNSNGSNAISGLHLSKVNVFFKDLQFLSAKRHELYGVVDIFSKVGGLCGLCIGLSVISVVEVIYFFTLRILCNFKKYGKKFST